MLVEPTVVSLIVAKLRKGKLKNIEQIDIKGWYLFIIAALIQLTASFLKTSSLKQIGVLVEQYFIYIHSFSYLLILIGLLLNIKKNSIRLILIGALLNFLVITANGGKMPVAVDGLKSVNASNITVSHEPFDIIHTKVTQSTKLVFLADIIVIPKPYPLAKVLSVGDLFIMLGIFIFFQEAMVIKLH